jgi:hypothetical protein
VEHKTVSRTYRRHPDDDLNIRTRRVARRHAEKPFRCTHCKVMVGPLPSGGKHRNHCPYCLHSRHVDGRIPGDRASECGGSMAPIGAFTRRSGEHVVVHRCLSCRFERYNRIAADDYFELVLSLPLIEARPSPPMAQPSQQVAEPFAAQLSA